VCVLLLCTHQKRSFQQLPESNPTSQADLSLLTSQSLPLPHLRIQPSLPNRSLHDELCCSSRCPVESSVMTSSGFSQAELSATPAAPAGLTHWHWLPPAPTTVVPPWLTRCALGRSTIYHERKKCCATTLHTLDTASDGRVWAPPVGAGCEHTTAKITRWAGTAAVAKKTAITEPPEPPKHGRPITVSHHACAAFICHVVDWWLSCSISSSSSQYEPPRPFGSLDWPSPSAKPPVLLVPPGLPEPPAGGRPG
jgi:hypothetical protein